MAKPGKIRKKLAGLLSEALPDVNIKPEELYVQPYSESSRKAGSCLWFALSTFKSGQKCEILSWNTMKDCVDRGVVAIVPDRRRGVVFCDFEIDAKPK